MFFKCKNGKSIYYYVESTRPNEIRKTDFFVSDISGILNITNPEIRQLIYITGFEQFIISDSAITREYPEMLKEFIESFKDFFIILRMGYDDSEDPLSSIYKMNLIEQYVAANKVGFINITSYTGLEYSQTFVYKNNMSEKFLDAIYRYEILSWLPGEFTNNEIFKTGEYHASET